MMGAPDKIWALAYEGVQDSGHWNSAEGVVDGTQYIRTDLTPPAADYVAGLFDIAPSIGAPTAEPTLRQVLEAYYKPWFGDDKIKELTQQYIDTLAARPAAPDTPALTTDKEKKT